MQTKVITVDFANKNEKFTEFAAAVSGLDIGVLGTCSLSI